MKGVQCYELFGGIALKIHIFSFSFLYKNENKQNNNNSVNIELGKTNILKALYMMQIKKMK